MNKFISRASFVKNNVYALSACLSIIFMVLSGAPASALDYQQEFTQKIDTTFFSSLVAREGEPRAIFAECQDCEDDLIIYAVYKNPDFYLTAKLPAAFEKFISPEVLNSKKIVFETYKKGGSVFYGRGTAFNLKAEPLQGLSCEITYVPYYINCGANSAFICDKGYLKINMEGGKKFDKLKAAAGLFNFIFSGHKVRLKKKVKYNQYYYERGDYFGYINRRMPHSDDLYSNKVLFYPTHKITYNRRISDHSEKHMLDMHQAVSFLKPDYPLLSRDMRAKKSLIEDYIKVKFESIEHSDLGSGQNTYIFLSYGPGINYFDGPCPETKDQFPAPRFIFNKDMIFLESAQFYPKNSWESFGPGIKRYNEINLFQMRLPVTPISVNFGVLEQNHNFKDNIFYGKNIFDNSQNANSSADFATKPSYDEPVFMPFDIRLDYLGEINDKIISYGLLTDTSESILKFDFFMQKHRGNVINNEFRTLDAVYPAFSSAALIVAPGTKDEYIKTFEEYMKKYGLIEYIAGVHYRDYFIEAHERSERGMRTAYLKYLIAGTDLRLNAMANSFATPDTSKPRKMRPGYDIFMKACEKIIKKDKNNFFESEAAAFASSWNIKVKETFRDYLYTVRTSKPAAIQKKALNKFIKLYAQYLQLLNQKLF